MTNHKHPITPPLELVQQWWTVAQTLESDDSQEIRFIANVAARWGADQELEMCYTEVTFWGSNGMADKLRAARRPRALTDKEQALADLDSMSIEPCLINGIDVNASVRAKYNNIRRAIEALPND
jgi:hypothetical protein